MPATLKEHLDSLNTKHIYPIGAYCQLLYNRKTYIYFIQSEDGFIKIGCTQTLKKRIKAIQACNALKIKLIGKMKGGYDLESELHLKFKRYRKRGEWFHPVPELLEYIAENNINKEKG